MHNFRWVVLLICFLALSHLVMNAPRPATASDLDGNGLPDALELALAEKFKPAFMLHADRIVEPEPIEILGATSIQGVYVRVWNVQGEFVGEYPYCQLFPANCGSDAYSHLDSRAPQLDYFQPPGQPLQEYQWSAYLEYGPPGNETEAAWLSSYVLGDSRTAPASQYDPIVYAHIFPVNVANALWTIQYWYYYPYNEWLLNHEGDWEHINVNIGWSDILDPVVDQQAIIDSANIRNVSYYFHQTYLTLIKGGGTPDLFQAHVLDDTHPVVYVGGFGRLIYAGQTLEGNHSGGSFPSAGSYSCAAAEPSCTAEIIEVGGGFIDYQDVAVKIWPNVALHGGGGGPIGDAYFAANPQDSWMRAAIPSGHVITDQPAWAVDLVAAWAPFGPNTFAPLPPPYQPTWRSNTPGDPFVPYMSGSSIPALDTNNYLLSLRLVSASGELPGTTFLEDSSLTQPGYKVYSQSSLPMNIEVGAPRYSEKDGELFRFSGWYNSAENSTITPLSLSVGPSKFPSSILRAEYESVGPGSIFTAVPAPGNPTSKAPHVWADIDGDGQVELFAYEGTSISWYRALAFGGGVSFIDRSALLPFANYFENVVALLPGDYNGDGLEDLYIVQSLDSASSGTNIVWINTGDGTLEVASIPALELKDKFVGGCVFAADEDARSDVYLMLDSTSSLANDLLATSPNGAWQAMEISNPTGHYSVSTLDFNSDQKTDLFRLARPGSGIASHFLMNASSGQFENLPINSGIVGERAVWGDYQNDGLPDVLVSDANGHALYSKNDYGILEDTADLLPSYLRNARSLSIGWGDFDNDGFVDILALMESGAVVIAENAISNEGAGFGLLAYLEPRPNGYAYPDRLRSTWCDLDADRDLDVFIQTDGEGELYLNGSTHSNGSVRLSLHAPLGQEHSVGGAQVSVWTSSGTQSSLVDRSGSVQSAPGSVLFGVGEADVIDRIQVRWPSGAVSNEYFIAANTDLEISEGASQNDASGRLSLSFDATSSVSTLTVSPFEQFSFYVVADLETGAGSMNGWESAVNLPPTLAVTGRELIPESSFDLGGGNSQSAQDVWMVGLGQSCISPSETPYAVLRYDAMLTSSANDLRVSLAPIGSPSAISQTVGASPAWISCATADVVIPFDQSWAKTWLTVNPSSAQPAPRLVYATLVSDQRIVAAFDRAIDSTDLETLSNYSVKFVASGEGIMLRDVTRFADNIAHLELGAPLVTEEVLELEAVGVHDEQGNLVSPTHSLVQIYNPASAYRIVINEIMIKPSALGDVGEWFEVFNLGNTDIDLLGWRIKDSEGGVHTITSPILVPPGRARVLARNEVVHEATDGCSFCEVYEYGEDISFVDDVGSVSIVAPSGELIDQVAWSAAAGWGIVDNHSLQWVGAGDNQSPNGWRYEGPIYNESLALRGTPFYPNQIPTAAPVAADMQVVLQAEPNPFNSQIVLRLAYDGSIVTFQIFDLHGRKIRSLVASEVEAGIQQAIWDGTDAVGKPVSSGVYFVSGSDGMPLFAGKVLLIK